MGLTLHYSARLTSLDCLPEVVDEVADICRCNGWKYILLDFKPDDPDIIGIIFHLARSSSPRRCLITRRTHAG